MTKKELSQYRDLKREIQSLEKRMERLNNQDREEVKDSVTGSSSNYPYIKQHYRIEGVIDNGWRIGYLSRLLNRRKEMANELLVHIEEFIGEIEDSELRQIFEMRYIDGMTWQRVAEEMGEGGEQYPRKKHDRYLERQKGRCVQSVRKVRK